MVARITAAEARKLGIDPKVGRTRTTRRTAKGVEYRTRCCVCDEIFESRKAEDQHLERTQHARYALLLTD